jgi:hypothetical protein
MLHNATVNIAGNPMTSHNVEAVAQMAIGHERLIVKEAEVMEKESEHNQTKFEVHHSCISIYAYFRYSIMANTCSSKHSSCSLHDLNQVNQIRPLISKALRIVSCQIQNQTAMETG